jgi:pimeloyl-ACP methyl ester carboxylesterase
MTNSPIEDDAADDAGFDHAAFWTQFRHGAATVGGVRLHYVEGGSGPPVLLLPGWPQSWHAWRLVMPMLAASGRWVIALDPRGMGDSARPASGYDMRSVAAEIHGFAEALGLAAGNGLDVAGHDLGTWMGYAFAADWPGDVRRLAVMDALLPGLTPAPPAGIPSAETNLKTWHFAFNRLDDLPEILVQGREREFLTWLFASKATRAWRIGQDGLDEYVRVFAAPGALRAALAYYRAAFSPDALAQGPARAERKLSIPVLALGAETGVGDMLLNTMRLVATDVRGGTVNDCGHYMPEERPRTVADALIRFLSDDAG